MDTNDFKQTLAPFFWVEHDDYFSVCLYAGDVDAYQAVFDSRADEGFEGSGYDWTSLAVVFVAEQLPELVEIIEFDPEAGMFCAYCSDEQALKTFVLAFKEALENKELILDIFSRAELD